MSTHQRLLPLVAAMMLLVPTKGVAQLGPIGSGDIPVIDRSNLQVNAETAAHTAEIAQHTAKLVALAIQNLQRVYGSYYDMSRYLAELQETLLALPPEQVITYLHDVDLYMQARFPGYFPLLEPWPDFYLASSDTGLNTLRLTLNTVRSELSPSDDVRLQGVINELKGKTENAKGNLDVSQTGNYIGIYTLEEQRRLRHMIGAMTNAYNVAVAHQINIDASAERAMHDWVEKSQILTHAYSGQGGFGQVGPVEGRHTLVSR